jgi:SNF2 family DNA or RNA helicase
MLSGTPITNRINDMFSYLKMAHHPLGKNKSKFEDRYTLKVGARGGKIIGAKKKRGIENSYTLLVRITLFSMRLFFQYY